MKIYLPNHEIQEISYIDAQDIPLAYIDTKDTTYEATFRLEEKFASNKKSIVRAYQSIPDPKTILFDADKKPIQNLSYRRRGNQYFYEPDNMTEFTPSSFTCTALYQKQLKYNSSELYNLKVGVIEKDEDFSFASKLISIFGDANRRGICPPNVTVNSGEMTPESLLGAADSYSDFIFVQSSDGLNFDGLHLSTILQKHVNVWISSSQWDKTKSKVPHTIKKEGHLNGLYKDTDRKHLSKYLFDEKKDRLFGFLDEDCKYSFPYEDVMIIRKQDQGFIIVTPSELLDNCGDNVKVIYDILLYIYFHAYKQTEPVTSWITNETVDYRAFSNIPLKRFHNKIMLDDLIAKNGANIKKQYRLIKISSSNKNVSYISMSPERELFFRKTSKKYVDPVKPKGSISYLTTKGTIAIYQQQEVYRMATRLNLTSKSVEGGVHVIVGPMQDSYRAIYSATEQELVVPDIKLVWYLCTKAGNPFVENTFRLVEQGQYSLKKDGYKMAEIRIVTHYDTKLIDVRTLGGGLPAAEEDVYNLIDIGNVYGRPYRLGSTLIIRLPHRLEPYKDKIRDAVKQHISAEDYPIFIFE